MKRSPLKRKTPLSRVSKKMRSNKTKYSKLSKEHLLANPWCEKCLALRSTQIHHKKGRLGKLLCDTQFFMAVCIHCHRYIEENRLEAYSRGWLIARY
jgi:hypothetical protein